MNVGLLWYDGDAQRPLTDKVDQAAVRHHHKYNRWPNTCYVHPAAMDGSGFALPAPGGESRGAIRVLPAPNVLPNHLWIGCEEQYDG